MTFAERLPDTRGFVSEHPGQQSSDYVDYNGCGEFSTAEDEIANGQLFIGQMSRHTLIDTLIPAANHQKFLATAEPSCGLLIEHPALSREQNNPS